MKMKTAIRMKSTSDITPKTLYPPEVFSDSKVTMKVSLAVSYMFKA